MKVLIDTNIVLDVLSKRPGFYEASAEVFRLCEIKKITGVLSALSIPNLVYILRKELDAEKTRDILSRLLLLFSVADLKTEDLMRAAEMSFRDYEDAVQSACALRVKADYIITRNGKDFEKSPIKAIAPSELLTKLG